MTTIPSTGQITPAAISAPAVIAWADFYRADDVAIPEGFVDIDEAVESLEKDPTVKSGMESARTRIAEQIPIHDRGLAYLRLRRGWSQKRLADAIGTSQSHIARIEAGRSNVFLDTANQLARALGTTIVEINNALGFGENQV